MICANIAGQSAAMVHLSLAVYGNNNGSNYLFIEVGKWHVALWIQDADTKKITGFKFFEYNAHEPEDFTEIFLLIKTQSQLFDHPYVKVHIIWQYPESMLVPASYAHSVTPAEYLEAMFGNRYNHAAFIQPSEDKAVVYRLPVAWLQVVQQHFPNAVATHKYQHIHPAKGNTIRLILYHKYFIVAAWKQSELQVMRTIDFSVPEDILYWMALVQSTYFSEAAATVIVSGMAATDSKLYKTLQMYIADLRTDTADADCFEKDIFKDHPQHYFSHFICHSA
jgi:hypothetical protein